jgi:hypothetical protein
MTMGEGADERKETATAPIPLSGRGSENISEEDLWMLKLLKDEVDEVRIRWLEVGGVWLRVEESCEVNESERDGVVWWGGSEVREDSLRE